MRFFFYGTLLDPALRTALIGPMPATPAVLRGFRRVRVQGRPYPALVPERGGVVAGLVVEHVGPAAAARLRDYEGPEYLAREQPVRLDTGERRQALVFLPRQRLALTDEAWNLRLAAQPRSACRAVAARAGRLAAGQASPSTAMQSRFCFSSFLHASTAAVRVMPESRAR